MKEDQVFFRTKDATRITEIEGEDIEGQARPIDFIRSSFVQLVKNEAWGWALYEIISVRKQ